MQKSASSPFFTVITPSWNQGKYLSDCIVSALAQNDPDFEHLVFDNCSSDSTAVVAASFPHIRFVSEPDRGQSHAVNKGFLAARGEVVCWLNADDSYPAGLFACLRQVFAEPSCDVVFGDTEQVFYDGTAPARAYGAFPDRLEMVRWWDSKVRLHQPAVFLRRRVVLETGLLREDLHYAMDYEYWWRVSGKFRFCYIPKVLAIQHRQPESKTIVAWHKVNEERAEIFSPFYHLIDKGDRRALLVQQKKELAKRYITNAFATASIDRRATLQNIARALGCSPAEVLKPGTLGILARLLFRSRSPN